MSTSIVYGSTHAALRQLLPTVIDSQLDSLSLAMVAVVQSMSSQVAKIARAMRLDTTAHSKEQRLSRLLDNARLTQTVHYQPIVKQALHALTHQRVQLLIGCRSTISTTSWWSMSASGAGRSHWSGKPFGFRPCRLRQRPDANARIARPRHVSG